MKSILCVVMFWACLPINNKAQQQFGLPAARGAVQIQNEKQSADKVITYALVVGISDYQDPGIPDLRFADKDAEAFANYLRSKAGGSLDNDHLKVLLNQDATVAQFAMALDWLMEVVKENDQVFIYFSGHGDVEKKTITQPGYLLCWDAPSRVYLAGGALALPMFQDIITTLSSQNKAKVIVITDACRSGKLAGSSVGGSQITGANLAKQFSNEIKILSCQPNEYSLEGEQWGGGRGIFSYHLVDGLYGMADRNGDGSVTVGEIDRYLEDKVTVEAAPLSQVPMLLGNKAETLSLVSYSQLAELKKLKKEGMAVFASTESRGFEEQVLAKLDSGIQLKYLAFKLAVQEKRFFSHAGNAADDFYKQLTSLEELLPLFGMMKRNYAAALQDDAQQTLNAWLRTTQDISLEVVSNSTLPQKVFTDKVRTYSKCLERAAEILGSNHYMYALLKARKFFFEGYLLAHSNRNPNIELGNQTLKLFRQSLNWQPEQPHVYWQMSSVFGWNFLQADSVEYYTNKARELHPNWIRPLVDATFLLSFRFRDQVRAKVFLMEANRIDSNDLEVLHHWAVFNFGNKNFNKAEELLKRVITIDSNQVIVWTNLGYCYYLMKNYDKAINSLLKAIKCDTTHTTAWNNLGTCYNQIQKYREAEEVLKKAISLDSTNYHAWNNLGNCYNQNRRFDQAEKALLKCILLDSAKAQAWNNLGFCYLHSKRFHQAETSLMKAISLDSTFVPAFNNLGNCYLQTQQFEKAEPLFKNAIKLDSTHFFAWSNLGFCFLQMKNYVAAEIVLNKAIMLDSSLANPFRHIGMIYLKTNRLQEAKNNFLKSLELNPNYLAAILSMAYLSLAENKLSDAYYFVEKAIIKGSSFEQLVKDEDLAPFRALPEYKELMKKYFPDKMK